MDTVYPKPFLTTDVVAFRYFSAKLQVLLIERRKPPFAGKPALPGGYVNSDETPETAAKRELAEETNMGDILLCPVNAFGSPGRDSRGWTVSICYLGIAPPDCQIAAGDDASDAFWCDLKDLPELAFDHNEMVHAAVGRLRELTQVGTLPLRLLPKTFRTAQARKLYSQLLDEPVSPRAFKAWLRRRQGVRRVGPARFEAAEALTRDWLR